MSAIVQEELSHFHLVLDILERRGIRFRKISASKYGGRLHVLASKEEPMRAVDRLLIAALIEARSCERFGLLRDRLADRELADFFGSLFESEARHHSTYVRSPSCSPGGTRYVPPRRTGRGRGGHHRRRRGISAHAQLISVRNRLS